MLGLLISMSSDVAFSHIGLSWMGEAAAEIKLLRPLSNKKVLHC